MVVLPLNARENTIYEFGPKTGKILIITTPRQDDTFVIDQLEQLIQTLQKNPPSSRIAVIITENDFSVLPKKLRDNYPEGTRKVIQFLDEQESGEVILLLPGTQDSVLIRNGASGKTTPRLILAKMIASLERSHTTWKLEEYRTTLFRMGWISGNPLLTAYLDVDIPAVLLETNQDLSLFLLDLIDSFEFTANQNIDKHYIVMKFRDKVYFVSEVVMVIAMIIALTFILFSIFIFSFLFGEKKDQHLKELLHLWWFPFLYLFVNTACLYIGQALVSFLFSFRFGSADSWMLLPSMAFAGKLALSLFCISLVISLNQLIRFPEDNFIYGYIASIVCMVNIFVFSSLDFSFSPLFFLVYLISVIAYQMRHPVLQILCIILLLLPFYPYLQALFASPGETLAPLYTGKNFWNVQIALFIMPFQLMLTRLFITLGFFGRKPHFYFPINLVILFLLAVFFTAIILFLPAWSKNKPLTVPVRQTINSRGSQVSLDLPLLLHNLRLESESDSLNTMSSDPSSYIDVKTSVKYFLDRQLVSISIIPSILVQRIEITVTSKNGLSVHDASLPFELLDAGMKGIFTISENTDKQLIVNFSSDRDSILSLTVRAWTRDNPWGYVIKNEGLAIDFLLEIEKTTDIGQKVQTENNQ